MSSPLPLYSAFIFCQNVGWNFIIQFHVCFLATETHWGLELSQRSFSMVGYHTQLIYMTFKTYCIGFKSRESLGHSNTDVPLISKMCFAVLIQRSLPCTCTNSFRIIVLNPREDVWNIMERSCESLPNNKFRSLWYSVRRNKT